MLILAVFAKSFGESWKATAASLDWKASKGQLRRLAYVFFYARRVEERYKAKNKRTGHEEDGPRQKKPRFVCRELVYWKPNGAKCRLEVLGDSEVIISSLN